MSVNYKFSLNEIAENYAVLHLGETQEVRDISIRKVRKYLENNSELNAKQDDYSILVFLRCCKFNVERTIVKIRNYYKMRSKIPEWFSDRDPALPEIDELVRLGVFVPIMYPDDETTGPLVVVIRTAAHDPSKHAQDNVFKAGNMILDLAVRHCECATIYGVYAIFDMANVTYYHAKQLPPRKIKKAVFSWQNYYCRPQLLEFVNAPVYVNVVLNVFRIFMTRKLRDRVHVHFSGFEQLHKVVPKSALPEEYGGTRGPLHRFIDFWRQKLHENVEWFQENEKYKADLD